MVTYANLSSEAINEKEFELNVVNLTTEKEYDFTNLSRKEALLSAYAMENGLMSNYIKNGYESLDGANKIVEGKHCYSIGDLTVLKKRNIPQPEEVVSMFDNNGVTMDRYTICLDDVNGSSWVVATNGCMSVWSCDEQLPINESELTEDDKHIGQAITWDALPAALQKHIKWYFEL